jgi:hypothetical protein
VEKLSFSGNLVEEFPSWTSFLLTSFGVAVVFGFAVAIVVVPFGGLADLAGEGAFFGETVFFDEVGGGDFVLDNIALDAGAGFGNGSTSIGKFMITSMSLLFLVDLGGMTS